MSKNIIFGGFPVVRPLHLKCGKGLVITTDAQSTIEAILWDFFIDQERIAIAEMEFRKAGKSQSSLFFSTDGFREVAPRVYFSICPSVKRVNKYLLIKYKMPEEYSAQIRHYEDEL